MRTVRSVEVAAVVVDTFGEEPLLLLDMVDSWALEVLRIFRETSAPAEVPDLAWGVHDYCAMLSLRDSLEQALARNPQRIELPAVAAVDELFRSFTVLDPSRALRGKGFEVTSEQWWWDRLPIAGPVVEELAAW